MYQVIFGEHSSPQFVKNQNNSNLSNMNLTIGIISLILLIPSAGETYSLFHYNYLTISSDSTVSIKCYVCHKDITNCAENPPPTLLRECDEKISFCFTQADHIIVRGCFHNNSGISLHLRAFTRLCEEDGCNNEPFISRSQLKCQVCTEDGCEGNLRECQHNIILYRKDFCYSALSGSRLLKGCLLEADEHVQSLCNPMDVHRDRCVTCQYDGCNRPLIPPLHTRCLSSGASAAVDCRSFKSSDKIGCFSRHSANGRLELGCNTQLSEESFKECARVSNDTCQLCMKSMCNNLQDGKCSTGCAINILETNISIK